MIKFVDDEDDGDEVEKDQANNDVTHTYDVTKTYDATPQNIFTNFKINGKNNFNNGDHKCELSEEEDENPENEREIINKRFLKTCEKNSVQNN